MAGKKGVRAHKANLVKHLKRRGVPHKAAKGLVDEAHRQAMLAQHAPLITRLASTFMRRRPPT